MPHEPDLSPAQADSDDDDVTIALSHLAALAADVEDLEGVLARMAGFAVDAIPGADGAGMTLVRLTDVQQPRRYAWSATHPFVREIDRLQYEVCGEGPCLTAMETQRPLVSGSVGSDARWSRFGGRVARLAVHSALALPLVVQDHVVGAINVYARQRDVFTEHAIRLGERFAGPASVAIHNTRVLQATRDHAFHLQTALRTRALIDQAIGIVRSRSGGSAEEAFDRLRQISQAENVKVAVVAQRLVDEAVRRANMRHQDS